MSGRRSGRMVAAMAHDPIAYTYDADVHCPGCAKARFGVCSDGWIGCCDATDSEGNHVGVIAPWDEWCDPIDGEPVHTLACGTCYGVISSHDNTKGW